MHEEHETLIPIFEGSIDQVKELERLCRNHGLTSAMPVQTAEGSGSS